MSYRTFLRPFICLGVFVLQLAAAQQGAAQEKARAVIQIGLQPLGYPSAMLGALMGRDAILRRELSKQGLAVRFLPYRKGSEMVQQFGKGLQGGILGDMPVVRSATQNDLCVVGLAKQTFTSVVSNKVNLLAQLKGKRVGYAEGSSAHYTLLQALAGARLTERDVTLVPLDIDAMPEALRRGEVDAFSAWEPAVTLGLASDRDARVLFRGVSSDYFVLLEDLTRREPEAALALAAALVRAVNWMRKSAANSDQAALWARKDGETMTGVPCRLSLSQASDITKRDLLDVPAAPAIPRRAGGQPLGDEFRFLKAHGKLHPLADERRLSRAFAYEGLKNVLRSPRRYRINEFDYQP